MPSLHLNGRSEVDLAKRERQPTGIQSVWQFLDAQRLIKSHLSAGLGPTPFDEEVVATLQVGYSREIDCVNYFHCLDVAARMDWPGMTCTGCTRLKTRTELAAKLLQGAQER